jgi:hypothetical protein
VSSFDHLFVEGDFCEFVLAGKIVIPNARYRNDTGQRLIQEDSRSSKRVGITRF